MARESKLWKDWTTEDWKEAQYCPECGLPLLYIPEESGEGRYLYQCIFCTWISDEEIVTRGLRKRISDLEKVLRQVRDMSKSSVSDNCPSPSFYSFINRVITTINEVLHEEEL